MHLLLTTQRLNTCGEWAFASRVCKWKITDWRYTLLQSIFHPCISRTAPVDLINNGSTVIHEMPPRSPSSLLLTAHLQPHCRCTYIQLSHRLNRLSEHFSLTAAYSPVKPRWFFRLSGVMSFSGVWMCSNFLPLKLHLLMQLLLGRLSLSLSWAEFWTRYLQRY